MQATYHGDVRLSFKAVGGVTAPGRMSVQRCNWTGTVAVTRRLAHPGGADAVFDAGAAWLHEAGPVRFNAGAVAHLFAGGAGRLDYGKIQGGAQALVGPLDIDLSASYAPRQRAIGGDNLSLRAGAGLAVIGRPFTLSADVGRGGAPATAAFRRHAGDTVIGRMTISL